MADWPLQEVGRIAPLGLSATIPGGVTVTNGAANVKGAWAPLGNAPYDASAIILNLLATTSTADRLVDIGFGASGSERVVIENIPATLTISGTGAKQFFFPLRVPANTRISVRSQGANAAVLQAGIHLLEESFEGFPGCSRFHTYGSLPATSLGTALGAPGAGAWGAWTEMTPGCATDHIWISGIVSDLNIATRTSGQRFAMQVGTGSAGNEIVSQPEMWWSSTSAVFGISTFYGIWNAIKAGQRLSMRYGSSAATTLGAGGVIIAGSD